MRGLSRTNGWSFRSALGGAGRLWSKAMPQTPSTLAAKEPSRATTVSAPRLRFNAPIKAPTAMLGKKSTSLRSTTGSVEVFTHRCRAHRKSSTASSSTDPLTASVR